MVFSKVESNRTQHGEQWLLSGRGTGSQDRMHSEGLMHCQGICAPATSTEPTWGRELDDFLMSCMTVALEQNHPTWPLPPHIFIPTHFQALFLGSLHFCLTLCQPLLLWSYKFLFYGQQTFTFSSSTRLIWPTAASLFPSGRFLIKSVLLLNADKFPKVQFWSWYSEIIPIHPMVFRKF